MPRRKPVRDRRAFATPNHVTLECECHKRLGEFWPSDMSIAEATDGVWYVPYEYGEPVVADDWLRIVCPACGDDKQGRRWQIDEIVLEAVTRGSRRAVLTFNRRANRDQSWRPPRGMGEVVAFVGDLRAKHSPRVAVGEQATGASPSRDW